MLKDILTGWECSVLGDNDNISITKVCTKVCLSPKTQRSDDYFIEVIPESTDDTEKTNNIMKDIKSKACMHSKVLQLCMTLWDPVDCSPPGSSVHGILQARILEWVVFSSSMRSFQPRDWTYAFWGSYIAGGSLPLSHQGSLNQRLMIVNVTKWFSKDRKYH